MKEILIMNLSEIIITGLGVVIAYLLTEIGNRIKTKLDDEKIKGFVDDTVGFVNQAHELLTNKEKYDLAVLEIQEWLATEGLKMTESKLRVLIEASVGKQKK